MTSESKTNIILIGFMGCGKSTLGKKIAEKLSFSFVDMDAEIEKQEKISISEIFKTKGEEHFRALEHQMLLSFVSKTNLVISTGGGTPCFYNNMEIINSIGKSIYIDLPAETLAQRLENEKSKRPLIADLSKEELLLYIQKKLNERKAFYALAQIEFSPVESSDSQLISYLKQYL